MPASRRRYNLRHAMPASRRRYNLRHAMPASRRRYNLRHAMPASRWRYNLRHAMPASRRRYNLRHAMPASRQRYLLVGIATNINPRPVQKPSLPWVVQNIVHGMVVLSFVTDQPVVVLTLPEFAIPIQQPIRLLGCI